MSEEEMLGLHLLLGGKVVRISSSLTSDSLVIEDIRGKTWQVRPMITGYAEPKGIGKLDISHYAMQLE